MAARAPLPASLPGAAPQATAALPPDRRRWRSADLLGPLQEVEIEHRGAVYRLRQTSLGKLILTK
ncbi:MAG: hemin uptake protein HemP [Rubrivivax sp.]|nr:hemin uptake protein HemP [Rubrivivax sp.]